MLSYHTCPLATLGGKDTGGMNVYVRELSKQLAAMGIMVDVFTRSQDEHVPHVVHSLGFGARVVHVPSGPELPLPKKELAEHIPAYVDYIKEFAERKEIKYDLIHAHYWMSGMAGLALKEAWDVPMVQMFHTLGLMKNRIAGKGEYEGDYRISGERKVLKGTEMVVAATEAELTQLQWLYEIKKEKIRVVPPGVNLRRFYPIPRDEAVENLDVDGKHRTILFVGRIEPLKGIETLLRAIGVMRDHGGLERHDICLSVIGGDAAENEEGMSEEMARLQDLRKELGLDNSVTFLGKRSQDMLPYYYSMAEMVVMPSHYESFGMVALEAMACGSPVVASQVGGLAYLIQDGVTGYHVPDQNPELLADRLLMILDDDELHQRLSQQAADYAKGYAWDKIAYQILGVYEESIYKQRGHEDDWVDTI